MTLPLILAAVDAVVAVYLLTWALRRQRRDKPLVAIAGAVLAVCAVFLLLVGLAPDRPARQLPPAVTSTAV